MSNWTFEINYTSGSTDWYDITNQVLYDSIVIDEQLVGSEYKASDDIMTFQVKHESTTTNKLFSAEKKIKFKAYVNSTDYKFTGVIDPTFSQSINEFAGNISIEAVDNGYLLDVPLKLSVQLPSTIGGSANKIFATSSTADSIVHALLTTAGYSTGEIGTTGSILDTVQQVCETADGPTYRDVIDTLLHEYGYTYRFDEFGKFQTIKLRPSSTAYSHTFGSSNIAINPALTREKIVFDAEAVEVVWANLQEMTDLYLLDERADRDSDGHWTGSLLSTGGYWPENGSTEAVYQEYDLMKMEYSETGRRSRRRPGRVV